MRDELEWLRELDEDVQCLRGHTDKAHKEYGGFAVTANNLATSLKVKVSDRIAELIRAKAAEVVK